MKTNKHLKRISTKTARRRLHRKYRTYILTKLRNWNKTEPTITPVNVPPISEDVK